MKNASMGCNFDQNAFLKRHFVENLIILFSNILEIQNAYFDYHLTYSNSVLAAFEL